MAQGAAPIQITQLFTRQSYLDSALQERAVLIQPSGEPIIPSTAQRQTVQGYSVYLHSDSQTPIAIQFTGGQESKVSAPMIMTPGQFLRPFGASPNDGFNSFTWGLPFGWLGGGQATLLVFQSPQAETESLIGNEVIYYVSRFQIYDELPADVTYNWPNRFPWPKAIFGVRSPQGGNPLLSITPTKTLLRLRVDDVPDNTPYPARLYVRGSTEFDLNSAGVANTTDVTYRDLVFPCGAPSPSFPADAFPVIELDSDFNRIAADAGGVDFVNPDVDPETYIDVVRFGRLNG